jgi:hypothetical protein
MRRCFTPGRTGMHYVTHRSHQRQKHMFGVTCPSALFVEFIPVPPEHEKYCIDDSRLGCTRMHYVTRRSHQMQKQKFGVTCPATLFLETTQDPPEHEK